MLWKSCFSQSLNIIVKISLELQQGSFCLLVFICDLCVFVYVFDYYVQFGGSRPGPCADEIIFPPVSYTLNLSIFLIESHYVIQAGQGLPMKSLLTMTLQSFGFFPQDLGLHLCTSMPSLSLVCVKLP